LLCVQSPTGKMSAKVQFSNFSNGDKSAWPSLPQLPVWAQISMEPETSAKSWPFGWTVHGYNVRKKNIYLSPLKEKSGRFAFGAYQAD
jgi:hypothetical protein